jgi:hypothetical protein
VLQPPKVKVEELVTLRGTSLRSAQLQLLKSLDDCVEASGGRGLSGHDSLHQLSLHGDNEVQTPEAHMRTWGPVNSVAGHPKPNESDETRKGPYLVRQLSVFEIIG